MPFANKITKGCSIFLELLFQAKNLLARNLTVSSPCTLMMCSVHLLQDRMASSTGRSWLSLSHVILDEVLPVLDVKCVILCKLLV